MSVGLIALAFAYGGSELPELPAAAAQPVLGYMACLFEPLDDRIAEGVPSSSDRRQAIVADIIRQCRDRRNSAAEAANSALAGDERFGNSGHRQSVIQAWLTSFEDRLRFVVVENESFVQSARAEEACLTNGGTQC